MRTLTDVRADIAKLREELVLLEREAEDRFGLEQHGKDMIVALCQELISGHAFIAEYKQTNPSFRNAKGYWITKDDTKYDLTLQSQRLGTIWMKIEKDIHR